MTPDNPLLGLAVVLAAGLVGGELVARLRMPKVTGWIGTGILLRYTELPGLGTAAVQGFYPLVDFVLGYIAFSVGSALHLASLRNAGKRLALLILTEATITPGIVVLGLLAFGQPLDVAWVLAAVAIAGAPGTTMIVVQEARAKGVFVKTLVAAVALIDMVAVCAFAIVASLAKDGRHGLHPSTLLGALTAAGEEVGFAFGVGFSLALLLAALTRRLLGPYSLGPSFVAVILAAWGIASAVGTSSILACTFAGIALSNLQHDSARAGEAYLVPMGGVLFAGFYTMAGMRLDFTQIPAAAGLVAMFFLGRLAGKVLSSFMAMSLAGMLPKVRYYLGLALLPHGGVAVGLVLLVQETPALSHMADLVVTVGLSALAINQLVGPSMTRLALQQVGEVGLDRPRLLDFITEQNIVVGLEGQSKRAVIERLVKQLYATTDLTVRKGDLLRDILRREDEASTCLGEGFMVPHAVIGDKGPLRGVLGLSSPGLELGAPDGRPVHAVLLLAIPLSERNRHLEILSAFTSVIVGDLALREQLYHARTPAHAYGILHPRETTDFNYFLDETLAPNEARGR